jgi:hypothetical protein
MAATTCWRKITRRGLCVSAPSIRKASWPSMLLGSCAVSPDDWTRPSRFSPKPSRRTHASAPFIYFRPPRWLMRDGLMRRRRRQAGCLQCSLTFTFRPFAVSARDFAARMCLTGSRLEYGRQACRNRERATRRCMISDWTRRAGRRFVSPPSRLRANRATAASGQATLKLAKHYRSTNGLADADAVLAPALEGFSPTPEMSEVAEAQALLSQLGLRPHRAANTISRS